MLFVGNCSCEARRKLKVYCADLYGILWGGEWNLLIRNIFVDNFDRRGKGHVTMRLELREKETYEASIELALYPGKYRKRFESSSCLVMGRCTLD